jgi:phosphopantothenoylcysteine decarboxylase/phosphopantothenate--cysteine ligase
MRVETAREMRDAVMAALPADITVCAAAVADWRVEAAGQKIKKNGSGQPPALRLTENPDILAEISKPGPQRPRLVVGFAAETEKLAEHAAAKRVRKGCDWLVANDVGGTGNMGGDDNEILLLTDSGVEAWDKMDKTALARKLAARIGEVFA